MAKECDVCQFTTGQYYVDGKTSGGPWATMCLCCFQKAGVGLGTGRGQLYETAAGRKVAG